MKYLVLIGDGMADHKIDELGGKTPLQAAKTPNMDRLARQGRSGKLLTIPEGMPTGSAVANLSIFGYDPEKSYTGRGAIEAAAIGIPMGKNDYAFRCNLVTEENNLLKDYSSGHISNEESKELINLLNDNFKSNDIEFHKGVSYRHILLLKNIGFNLELDCRPPHDVIGKKILDIMIKPNNKESNQVARMLNKMILDSKMLLERHPVNFNRIKEKRNPANLIWPWAPGKKPVMEKFSLKGAVISAVDVIFGIGVLAGLDPIKVRGATGLYDTNYEGKADAAIKALKEKDIVFVHVEAPDEASHAGDLKLKIKTIEDFDKRLVGRVLEKVDDDVAIAVLPDHPTPIEIKTHAAEPVPFVIYNPKQKPDKVEEFNEFSCEEGSYGNKNTTEFIKLLLSK